MKILLSKGNITLVRYLIPAIITLLCICLKLNADYGSVNNLRWMLSPLAGIVGVLTGIGFSMDTVLGFVNPSGTIILGSSCSGINFMVIILLLSAFSFLPILSFKKQIIYGIALVPIAWIFTLLVNASRILIAMKLLQYGKSIPGFGSDKMHEAMGVLYYLSSLLIYFYTVRYFLTKQTPHEYTA